MIDIAKKVTTYTIIVTGVIMMIVNLTLTGYSLWVTRSVSKLKVENQQLESELESAIESNKLYEGLVDELKSSNDKFNTILTDINKLHDESKLESEKYINDLRVKLNETITQNKSISDKLNELSDCVSKPVGADVIELFQKPDNY